MSGYMGLMQSIQRFLLPLALIFYGWNVYEYGTIFLFQALSMALPFILGGFFSDLKGRRQTIAMGFFFSVIGSFLLVYSISKTSLIIIIIAQMITTMSNGIGQVGLSTILADETSEGQDRTENFGKSQAMRNIAGLVGPVFVGLLISGLEIYDLSININFSILSYPSYESGFILLSILGLFGICFTVFLPATPRMNIIINKAARMSDFSKNQRIMQSSFLAEELLIGFLSGAIVPFIDFYILTEFTPSDLIWGLVFGISNSTIALGNYFVGKYSERIGKGKAVFYLNIFAPMFALGIAFAPTLQVVAIFYILRAGIANAVQPAWQSWYFSHTLDSARGRTFSAIQLSRRLSRAGGSAIGPFLFSALGAFSFPTMCLFYPVAMVIPLLTENRLELSSSIESSLDHQIIDTGISKK
jgi:MFS family permease